MARITVEEPIPDSPDNEVSSNAEAAVSQESPLPVEPSPAPEPQPVIPSTTPITTEGNKKPAIARKWLFGGALLVVLIVLMVVVSLQRDRGKLKQELKTVRNAGQVQSATNTQEAEQLKQEIGRFYEVPTDELPTVATVADASKVKNQSFFANAQNGDKVLLFSKAGKAILYRPSTKKIIEIAPINLNDTEQSGSTTPPTPTTSPTNNTNR